MLRRMTSLFLVVFLVIGSLCSASAESAGYNADCFPGAAELCKEGKYQEALAVYLSSSYLQNEEKQALSLFASYYPAIVKNGTYDFSVMRNSKSSAYAAAVKIEKTYKNNSKYYVRQIYLITEAVLYVSIDDIFNQGFHEKGVSFASQVDPDYTGPFEEEIRSLVQFVAPGHMKATHSYFDLSLEEKAEIIAYANERYSYYDSLVGGYSGDMLTDAVFADAAEQYDLTVNDISMVWFDDEANQYYNTHYSSGETGKEAGSSGQDEEKYASEEMISDAIQLLSMAQSMLQSCDPADGLYADIVNTRRDLLMVLGASSGECDFSHEGVNNGDGRAWCREEK